jgi:hypothetical protein
LDLLIDVFVFGISLIPKPLGDSERVDIDILPPGDFITGLMQLSVMAAAERYGEFISHFRADGARLRKAQVMWIRQLSPADMTRLRSNKPPVACG